MQLYGTVFQNLRSIPISHFSPPSFSDSSSSSVASADPSTNFFIDILANTPYPRLDSTIPMLLKKSPNFNPAHPNSTPQPGTSGTPAALFQGVLSLLYNMIRYNLNQSNPLPISEDDVNFLISLLPLSSVLPASLITALRKFAAATIQQTSAPSDPVPHIDESPQMMEGQREIPEQEEEEDDFTQPPPPTDVESDLSVSVMQQPVRPQSLLLHDSDVFFECGRELVTVTQSLVGILSIIARTVCPPVSFSLPSC